MIGRLQTWVYFSMLQTFLCRIDWAVSIFQPKTLPNKSLCLALLTCRHFDRWAGQSKRGAVPGLEWKSHKKVILQVASFLLETHLLKLCGKMYFCVIHSARFQFRKTSNSMFWKIKLFFRNVRNYTEPLDFTLQVFIIETLKDQSWHDIHSAPSWPGQAYPCAHCAHCCSSSMQHVYLTL